MAELNMDRSDECTWPEIKQRVHYLGWLLVAIGTATLLGLTFDLAIVKLAGGEVGLELIPLLYLSAIVPPYVYIWRKHGEACCGFLELEHAMDTAFKEAGRSRPLFAHVVGLIERIDAARGMDRQLVRNEAKAWLLAHADKLSRDERDYVADHLGYLHKR
jgi:hypothetical protein